MRNITQEEAQKFRDITKGKFTNFILLATEFQGIETAVIASLNGLEGDYTTEPLAILVNKEIFALLKNPGDDLTEGGNLILV